MFRRIVVPCLVVALVAGLAVVASVRTTPNEAQARVASFEMNFLCHNLYTTMYRGVFSPNCQPHERLLSLPDDYPITLCSSTYDSWLRAPLPTTDQCPMPNSQRFDLPDDLPMEVCYYIWTGLLRPSINGACPGTAPARLATFPSGATANDDSYQTLGNVDIDVPAASGVLVNDTGSGLSVSNFQNPSANGGEVNVNPDGSFTYIPPMPDPQAFVGSDTFTYELEDGGGSTAVGTVTVEILSPSVWFVDADAGSPGDGRRQTPLADIQELNGDPDRDEPGDYIFLFEAQNLYQPGITLETGQTIIGQDVDLAEILAQTLSVNGSSLLGSGALPPFIVLPDVNPSIDSPVLSAASGAGNIALSMTDSTTAVGFVAVGINDGGVHVESAQDVVIDRMDITGGTDGSAGRSGVSTNASAVQIVDATLRGGSVGPAGPISGAGLLCEASSCDVLRSTVLGGATNAVAPNHTLQGLNLAAQGGSAINAHGSRLTVTSSTVAGADGASTGTSGAPGGAGIAATDSEITVTASSDVSGGNGGAGDVGGFGGPGIRNESGAFNGTSTLLGAGGELQPFIDVSGSDVNGGDGGAGAIASGGGGGDAIFAVHVTISVSNNSRLFGGTSGPNGPTTFFPGFAGDGIDWRMAGQFLSSEGSSQLQGVFGADPIISVIDSTVAGGVGGPATGESAPGSGGGGGIIPDNYTVIDASARMLYVENSTVSGGNGGPNGSLAFLPFGGGPGISVVQPFVPGNATASHSLQGAPIDPSVEIVDSTVTGGNGGPNGGSGGNGAIFEGGTSFVVSNTTITSGDGQDSAFAPPGVFVAHGGDLTINNGSTINTGSSTSSSAPSLLYTTNGAPGSFFIGLQDSAYNSGIEINQSSTGSVCLNATGNTISSGVIWLVQLNGTLGITQADVGSLEDDNPGASVLTLGTIDFSCGTPPAARGGR